MTGPDVNTDRHLGRFPVELPSIRDPRLPLAAVTTSLHVLGQFFYDFNLSIAQILLTVVTCATLDFTITLKRRGVIAWPSSGMLTGNSIALILRVPGTEHGDWWSLHGWYVFVAAGLLAVTSKYIVRWKGRHVFNPSNFVLVVVFIALGEDRVDPQVLWWGPWSIRLALAYVVIFAGSIGVTKRAKQTYGAISFWIVFALLMTVLTVNGHAITANWNVGPVQGLDYWLLLVTSPEVLVFVFFMITDPKTSPEGRVGQTLYGILIAAASAVFIAASGGEFGTKVGLLAGLVVVCAFVPLIRSVTPEYGSDEDSLRLAARSWLTGPDLREPSAIRISSLTLAVLAVVVGMVVLSNHASVDTTDFVDDDILSLRSRSEVTIDDLPEWSVDPDPPGGSRHLLTDDTAQQVVLDFMVDLDLEAMSIRERDVDLARASTTGARLRGTSARITAARDSDDTNGSSLDDGPVWRIDELVVTTFKADSGPQTPPEIAVAARGTVVRSVPSGEHERLDSVFTLTRSNDVHLINHEYDTEGDPIEDHTGDDTMAERPLEPSRATATKTDLHGLRLVEVGQEMGLDVPQAAAPHLEGPAVFSGGAAVADYDGDGLPDIYLSRVGLHDVLLRNDGGSFTDVTEQAGLPTTPRDGGSTGAVWADFDGDGILDLMVVGFGPTPNRMYVGGHEGMFTEVTDTWSFPSPQHADPDASAFSIAIGDYDGDGRLDALIIGSDPHHVTGALESAGVDPGGQCGIDARAALAAADTVPPTRRLTRLLRNTGSGFEDRTDDLGLDPSSVAGMAGHFIDVDDDGHPDIIVTGHFCTSKVLLNDGRGGFRDATHGSGLDVIEMANGVEIVDLNNDGLPDLVITGSAYPTRTTDCPLVSRRWRCGGNRVLIGNGDGTFDDRTADYGMADGYVSWGVTVTDLNDNGTSDLVMATGYQDLFFTGRTTERNSDWPFYERSRATPSLLWIDTGHGRWLEGSTAAGLADPDDPTGRANSKAVIAADFFGDDTTGLLFTNTGTAPDLYRNSGDDRNHWLRIDLRDNQSPANVYGIGARVIIRHGDGTMTTRWVRATGSFQSGTPATVHVGTGSSDRAASIEVRWPDGATQTLTDVGVDRRIIIERRS